MSGGAGVEIERIPKEIRTSDRAVVWKAEERDGRQTRVPYRPGDPSRKASSTDADTWGSFGTALSNVYDGKADGVGVALGDGLSGVDLDHCRDPESGEIEGWALEIVDRLDSYTEISPSGTGLHILAHGTLPDGRRRKDPIEMYSGSRYFTVTGDHLEGTPQKIHERTAELAALHAETFETNGGQEHRDSDSRPAPAADLHLSDRELLEKARNARNGDRFARLWAGDTSGYPSQSEADLALVNLLAFWTRGDAGRIDRLFRQSGLMREKWTREDYRERTINRALEGRTEFYEPEVADRADALLRGEPDPLADVDLVELAEFLEDPDAFAPPAVVAYGMTHEGQVTLLYGDPKGGKSTTAIGVGATVSSGSRWMHHPTKRGRVLYVAAEGDRRQILRRFHEFGGDPEGVDVVVPGLEPIDELRTLMQARDYRLVILDTLGRWMAPLDVDRWKQSDVDTVLTPLERMIRESGAALLAIHHANAEGKPIDSTGFAAWADVLRKVEDGDSERERVVTGRARFEVPDLRFCLVEQEGGSALVPSDQDREVRQQILDFLRSHDGASTRAIREGVNARNAAIDEALEELRESQVTVEREGAAMKHRIRS